MGMTLKDLKRRATKYDPDEVVEGETWVAREKKGKSKYLYEEYLQGELLGPKEDGEPSGSIEESLVSAVDLLDAVHILLIELSSKWDLDKQMDARVAEARDEVGEYIMSVVGAQGVQTFLM